MADTIQTYEKYRTAFSHANFEPLYFFYGEEQYLISELQSLLIENAIPQEQRDFNFDLLYGSEVEAEDVLGICTSYPVMAERRLVVVREFEKMEENRRFKEYAENPNPATIAFLACSTKPNLSAHPYRALKNHAEAAHFESLYERKIPNWIRSRVEAEGYRIDPAAVEVLAHLTGSDLHKAAAEIDKLTTYAGESEAITREDVLHVGGHAREYNVFELQDAIGEENYREALEIGERMLEKANNPRGEALMIVAVITKYFRKLLQLTGIDRRRMSKNKMAGHIGVPPYYVDDYLSALKRYDRAAIERAMGALLAADYELKGGSERDTRTVFVLLLMRIMDRSERSVPAGA